MTEAIRDWGAGTNSPGSLEKARAAVDAYELTGPGRRMTSKKIEEIGKNLLKALRHGKTKTTS